MEDRICNECLQEFIDVGDGECPFCGSDDIEPIDEDDDGYGPDNWLDDIIEENRIDEDDNR